MTSPFRLLRLIALAPILMLGSATLPSLAATTMGRDPVAIITAAAQSAQHRCYEFMHEDADEFISCIDALDGAMRGHDAAARYRHLGTTYFGWVGANNSARVALPGSEQAAAKYFLQYQQLRCRAGMDEAVLCPVVPGDCAVRLAQIAVTQRALGLPRVRISPHRLEPTRP